MKGLQSLVVLGLALAAMAPSHAQIKNADYPIPVVTQGTFNLAQAYPCTVSGYTGMGISNSQTWGGTCGVEALTNGAAPGGRPRRAEAGPAGTQGNTGNPEFPALIRKKQLVPAFPGRYEICHFRGGT